MQLLCAAVGRNSRNIDLQAGQPVPQYFVKQFETLPELSTEQMVLHASQGSNSGSGSIEQSFGISQQPRGLLSSLDEQKMLEGMFGRGSDLIASAALVRRGGLAVSPCWSCTLADTTRSCLLLLP